MAKQVLSIGALVMVIAMLVPLSIAASSNVSCRVPFSFVANGRTLPPGLYTLSTSQGYTIVRGVHDAAIVIGIAGRDRANGEARLVFLKTGERYDLSEVWTGNGAGLQIARSKHRADARLASNAPAERVVIVADTAAESR